MDEKAKNKHTKNQHYVPKFLLKNFSNENSEQVYVFSKTDGKEYQTNIRNIAAERYFYDLELGKAETSYEYRLGKLEDKASPIIQKILECESIRKLTDSQRIWIAMFVASQYIRTKAYRNDIASMNSDIISQLLKRGIDPNNISNYKPFSGEDEIRRFAISNFRMIRNIVPRLLDKQWMLCKSKNQFWISDNPVVLHNEYLNNDKYGNIGFAVPGIEIYLPLSPTYTLGFIDRQVFKQMVDTYEKQYFKLKDNNLFNLQNYVNSVRRRIPFLCDEEHEMYYNSLQLMYAEKQVFSQTCNFALARQIMLEQKGQYARPRFGIVSDISK